MSDTKDDAWVGQVADKLDRLEADVPSEVQLQLQAARRTAIAQAERQATQKETRSRKPWLSYTLLGSGAFASALVVSLVFLGQPEPALPLLEDAEMAAAMEVEMLEELEFLAWMIEEGELLDEGQQG